MKLTALAWSAVLFVAACGSAPPGELVSARAVLDNASYGLAAELDPAGLHVARNALELAEETYRREGACEKVRDRSYVAIRKVERAEVLARTRQLEAEGTMSHRRALKP